MDFPRILVLGCLIAAAVPAQSQILFDGASGTLPSDPEWLFFAARGLAEASHTGSAARLQTTADNLESAGFARQTPSHLERDPGFNIALRLRLNAETHSRPDRAGFSWIVLAEDRLGLELGFWTNLVFAQAADPLFTHAEEAAFDFAADFNDLILNVTGNSYTLLVNRIPLLAGPVRDYTAFTGFPDVYETPDFIFLGDDTTSAGADVEIASVALVQPPLLRTRGIEGIEWDGVPGQTYTVHAKSGLNPWTAEAQIHSTTTTFIYTNLGPVIDPRFLRVSHP